MQSLPAIMPIKIPYPACPVLPVLSCLATTPSECLYHDSCMYSRRYLQSTYRSAVMLVQPTNDPVPFPPRLDNRPTREATRRNNRK